jgi:group I intron endonuclease
MYLYLITNLLNNKQYVGITTQKNPYRRWVEHKSKALKNKNKNPIHSAIKKYGCENFKFEIVKELNSSCINELLEEETKLILKLNTLAPNGYNLKLKSSFRIASPELSRKLSRGNQGVSKLKNPSSRFIGVYKNRKSLSFSCEIAFQKEKYKKVFLLEEEAAKTYDMMAIYFYGRESKTNFHQSLYSDEQVNKCFSSFYERSSDFYTSKYKGVYFSKERNCYRARYKNRHIGQAPTEEEAYNKLQEYLKNNVT